MSSAARERRLRQLGEATKEHRRARRKALVQRGSERRAQQLQDGFSESYAEGSRNWYDSRAKGQEQRVERALSCGEDTLRITCACCGKSHERPGACRLHLWCVRCRGALASHKRAQFLASRAVVLSEARERGLFGSGYRRWSEKMLTLTLPHLPDDDIPTRIRIAFDAWRSFLKKVNRWKKTKQLSSLAWFRAFEWEQGSDGQGHPHFHLWVFSPFLPRDTMVQWWREAYAIASSRLSPETVIVDLRVLHGRAHDAQEIIKYLTKDIDAKGKVVPAEVFAEAYKEIDGRRLTQASSGFMSLGHSEEGVRCECGERAWNVERIRAEVQA